MRRVSRMAGLVFCLAILAACAEDAGRQAPESPETATVSVTGELRSSNSYFFGPPAIPDIWNYTIAYLAPDGMPVEEGRPVLRFDTLLLLLLLLFPLLVLILISFPSFPFSLEV